MPDFHRLIIEPQLICSNLYVSNIKLPSAFVEPNVLRVPLSKQARAIIKMAIADSK